MKYVLDHDLHIHSYLSPCSGDPEQTPENILKYAVKAGYRHICLTDHFWDADVPCAGDTWEGFDNINKALPLPQANGVEFHFGCEADMDRYSVVGLSRKNFDKLDFIIIPVGHLHLDFARVQREALDKKEQAIILAERFWNLLQLDLPFHKVGLAHITWDGLAGYTPNWKDHIDIINYISDDRWKLLFSESSEKGMGIEINVDVEDYKSDDEREAMLRPYRIAKECGCKFYFGSDAHNLKTLAKLPDRAEFFINKLHLTEDDKFRPFG